MGMAQNLGIMLHLHNPEHGCAFKSREKLSMTLLKSAEIMSTVCIFPGLTLACSTLHKPRNSSLDLLRGYWGVAGGKIYFSLPSHVLFYWKWSCF